MTTSQNRDRDFRGGGGGGGGDYRGGGGDFRGGGGDSRGGGGGDSRGGGGRPPTRRFTSRRRRQCVCKEVGSVGYKDISVLRRFISDRGRIESGRKAGNCAKCQRDLGNAISRARFLALLPYAPNHIRVTGSLAPATSHATEDEPEPDDELDIETGDAIDDEILGEDSVDESVEPIDDVESSEGDSEKPEENERPDVSSELSVSDESGDSAEPEGTENSEDSEEETVEKS